MKIGCIGLGQMGKHIALNLTKSGVPVIVKNSRNEETLRFFERQGVAVTRSLSDIAAADIVFLCLPDGTAVNSVIQELLPQLRAGQLLIDLSTIDYMTTLHLASQLADKGIVFLDAPVSGMESRAKEGTLTIMCGGSPDAFAAAKPYLEYIGTQILYMGKSGNGQLTKLINQLLYDINMAALAGILPMSVKLGLDPEKIGQVVNSSTGRSHASEYFIPHILTDQFENSYSLQNAYKDIVNATTLAAAKSIPLPVLHAAASTYQMALQKGLGSQDKGAMIKVFEDILDVQFRK